MIESNQLGNLLIIVYKYLKIKVEKDLKKYEIGMGQLQILMIFFSLKKPLSQNELVKALEVDKANISRSIVKLVAKGYLTPNIENRTYQLSDLGHQLKAQIGASFSNVNILMTHSIGPSEINCTVDTLFMIQKNLKENL